MINAAAVSSPGTCFRDATLYSPRCDVLRWAILRKNLRRPTWQNRKRRVGDKSVFELRPWGEGGAKLIFLLYKLKIIYNRLRKAHLPVTHSRK